MSADFDAVIIGAGHNGLVAAHTLAAAGKRVCVVEASGAPGGMAAAGTLDGVSLPRLAHLVRAGIGAGDGAVALPTVALAPDNRHVVIREGALSFADGGAHPDADAFAALHSRLRRFAGVLAPLMDAPPPDLSQRLASMASMRDIGKLMGLGWGLKRLGRTEMREFLRIMLSNAHDVILDRLPDGPAAGVLAADAVRGAHAGPRDPGTVLGLLYRMAQGGDAALPAGGMEQFCAALAQRAQGAGAEIRYGTPVRALRLEGDAVCGVALDDGTMIDARVVLSSLGAMPTMQMTGPAAHDIETVRRLRNLRSKGTAAKLNLVLRETPTIPGLPDNLRAGRLVIAPSVDTVERAFDPVKYAGMSQAPVIEAVLPTLTAPDPSGRQVLSVVAQYLPLAPDGGWTDAARQAAEARILSTLESCMPGLSDLIEARELLTPADIAAQTGAPGGHWHHGEMSVDQMLTVRPTNGTARYRFGPAGLYLCGAGAHPGGDITGAPGRNAARAAMTEGGAR